MKNDTLFEAKFKVAYDEFQRCQIEAIEKGTLREADKAAQRMIILYKGLQKFMKSKAREMVPALAQLSEKLKQKDEHRAAEASSGPQTRDLGDIRAAILAAMMSASRPEPATDRQPASSSAAGSLASGPAPKEPEGPAQ